MKRPWLYLVFPLVGAASIGALFAALGAEVPRAVLTAENVVVFAASAWGTQLAARSFGPRDYLRPVWSLLALCLALLGLDALLFGAASASLPRSTSASGALVSGALTIGANLASVVALIWVGRAWRVAGLDLQVSSRARWAALATVLVLAVAVLGRGIVEGTLAVAGGDLEALTLVASALGDLASAALPVPILLTAFSLRGGSLMWPWGLLSLGTILWLGFDASEVLAGALGASPQSMLPLDEALRAGACFFQLAAGLAQRAVVKV